MEGNYTFEPLAFFPFSYAMGPGSMEIPLGKETGPQDPRIGSPGRKDVRTEIIEIRQAAIMDIREVGNVSRNLSTGFFLIAANRALIGSKQYVL